MRSKPSAPILALTAALLVGAGGPHGDDPGERHPGLSALYSTPLQDYGVDVALFDDLWTVWTGDARRRAAAAEPGARRALVLEHYGLVLDPDRGNDVPVAFAEAGEGRWALNCLGCHSGQVDGALVHGLGGSTFDFIGFVRDMGTLRARRGLPIGLQETGMRLFPLSAGAGTTNAQTFSVHLASLRRPDLGFADERTALGRALPDAVNVDLDAPPLWHVARKSRLYLDGYVAKDARVPMQFSLGMAMGPERIKALEQPYAEIWDWIHTLEAPPWPGELDPDLASEGREVFEDTCARCHGTYGPGGTYPETRIPLDVVGTDPVRASSMPRAFRAFMQESWLTRGGDVDVELDPKGYVAPPLDGLWATAPYLHNGSVPTLWHLLHPEERPLVWRRTRRPYDRDAVGLSVDTADEVPRPLDPAERRQWFDGTAAGRSPAGHDFPKVLDEDERRALLEYLKTL